MTFILLLTVLMESDNKCGSWEKRESEGTEHVSMIWYGAIAVWFVLLACWISVIHKCHLILWQMNCEYEVWGENVTWTNNQCLFVFFWRLSHQRKCHSVVTITHSTKENYHQKLLFYAQQSSCSSYVCEHCWSTISYCWFPIKIFLQTRV